MSSSAPKVDAPSNAEKDPDTWTTGGEPMTGAQASYLQTLCEETNHPFDPDMTKADASTLIDELQSESARLNKKNG
jgi:hypothetical protein